MFGKRSNPDLVISSCLDLDLEENEPEGILDQKGGDGLAGILDINN